MTQVKMYSELHITVHEFDLIFSQKILIISKGIFSIDLSIDYFIIMFY